jgi:hypothetical protein
MLRYATLCKVVAADAEVGARERGHALLALERQAAARRLSRTVTPRVASRCVVLARIVCCVCLRPLGELEMQGEERAELDWTPEHAPAAEGKAGAEQDASASWKCTRVSWE